MTARDAVLSAFASLSRRTERGEFSPSEIVAECLANGWVGATSTLKTHICSRMCIDAPANHATVHADLVRVGRGRYRLR